MSNANHSEIELLKRLHRGAMAGLTALQELQERTPEDDLRLRALVRLEGRLMDRIEWMQAQDKGQGHAKQLRDAAVHPRAPAIPDSTAALSV